MDKQRRFVNQFMAGETVDQLFLVRQKDLRTTSNGQLYVACTLADKTGHVPARMWQVSEAIYNSIPAEGFIQVKGRTELYKGALQLVIDALRPWPAEKVNLADFLATTPQDIDKMWAEVVEILAAVKDKPLKALIKKFMEDHALVERFKRSPAAAQLHHAYIGGLLEHTLGVLRAAKALLPLYPKLNADLALAGVFLHDIGKAEELTGGTTLSYSDRGGLVGHIAIAVVWVAQKAQAVGEEMGEPFPARTLDLVQHLILSHHGSYDFGAVKLPAIPEAFLLHHLDNLDAKVYMTLNAIENDPDPSASFTAYMRQLETRVHKKSGEL